MNESYLLALSTFGTVRLTEILKQTLQNIEQIVCSVCTLTSIFFYRWLKDEIKDDTSRLAMI